MTIDPDFAPPEPPASDVALSNSTILVISITGFVVLASTVWHFLIKPSSTTQELEDIDANTYDDALEQADVRSLNRAQRRARARNRMKRKRRLDPRPNQQQQQVDGDGDEVEEGGNNQQQQQQQQLQLDADAFAAEIGGDENDVNDQERTHLSRKERAKIAKAAEKEERKLYEQERQEARKQAEVAAAGKRRQREKEKEASTLEQKKRRVLEEEKRKWKEHEEWKFMFTTGTTSSRSASDVRNFIERSREKKIWPINDIASVYAVTASQVEDRIKRLISDNRIFGIVSNGNFIFLEEDDLQAIADFIRNNGYTSMSDLSREISRIVE